MEFVYDTRNPSVPTAYSRLAAMHTQCEILLPGMEEAPARALCESVWELVREADRRYNRFAAGSVLAEVNRLAATEAVEVDDELFFILQMCDTFRKATLGYYDISAGSRVEDRSWKLDPAARTVRRSGSIRSVRPGPCRSHTFIIRTGRPTPSNWKERACPSPARIPADGDTSSTRTRATPWRRKAWSP